MKILRLSFVFLLSIAISKFAAADDQNRFAAKYVANLIKNAISDVSEDEYRKFITEQYNRIYLLDEEGNWEHAELEKLSDQIMPTINRDIAYSFIDELVVHVEENPWLMRFIAAAIQEEFPVLKQHYLTGGREVLAKAVAYGIALENLTQAQINDPAIIKACLDVWRLKRDEKISLWNQDMNPFSVSKLKTIEGPIQSFLEFHETGEVNPKFLVGLLPVNIMEALMTDLFNGYRDNAKAAWPLTINRPTYRVNEALGTGPAEWSEDEKIVLIKTPLTKEWNDLYQTWNMAFVSQFGPSPFYYGKLLIPAVNNYKDQPAGFLYKRFLALFTHLHFYFLGNVYDREHGIPSIEWGDRDFIKFWGKMNRQFADEYSQMVEEAKR